jgi:hypothetical protein
MNDGLDDIEFISIYCDCSCEGDVYPDVTHWSSEGDVYPDVTHWSNGEYCPDDESIHLYPPVGRQIDDEDDDSWEDSAHRNIPDPDLLQRIDDLLGPS